MALTVFYVRDKSINHGEMRLVYALTRKIVIKDRRSLTAFGMTSLCIGSSERYVSSRAIVRYLPIQKTEQPNVIFTYIHHL
jgi:hypothetical protein